MSDTYDIVTIGSGHNGLVAAAYLAAAGKKVLVLERNPWFGGGVVTRELTVPGFLHDQHSIAHIFIHGNPLLARDELGLKSRHGLKYVFPDTPMMSVFEDGSTLALHRDRERTCAEIARYSKKDADAYRKLAEEAAGYMPMLLAGLYSPPTPLGATYALMDQSREGRELWRTMQMSMHDLLGERFEHPRVRMHFARVAGENLVSPDEKATGFGVFVFVGFLEAYGIGVPIGGSGALTNALIASIREHGGEVQGNADVARVVVRNGRAVGVETRDGRTYTAKDAVIGAIHPHDLGRMVDGLAPEVTQAAARTHISEVACITLIAALDAPLRFRAGEHVRAAMIELLPNDYDTMRKSFDKVRYREFSDYPLIGVGSLTMFDPSRAPAGKATMHAWDYVPYERADGRSWDDTKASYVERMLEHMSKFIENLPGDVIAWHSDSPVDMERTSSSFRRGDLHGIGSFTYQSGAHRPTPDLGQNTVPGCERLYLVGPFQHPGGGVFGAGRATAVRMFDDLGLDFSKVGARQ
ncbi:MAG TPA: NAD(P)/FAD-dependent oxidoreductase [Gammaproteobacteria bacterium]